MVTRQELRRRRKEARKTGKKVASRKSSIPVGRKVNLSALSRRAFPEFKL